MIIIYYGYQGVYKRSSNKVRQTVCDNRTTIDNEGGFGNELNRSLVSYWPLVECTEGCNQTTKD